MGGGVRDVLTGKQRRWGGGSRGCNGAAARQHALVPPASRRSDVGRRVQSCNRACVFRLQMPAFGSKPTILGSSATRKGSVCSFFFFLHLKRLSFLFVFEVCLLKVSCLVFEFKL